MSGTPYIGGVIVASPDKRDEFNKPYNYMVSDRHINFNGADRDTIIVDREYFLANISLLLEWAAQRKKENPYDK